jgi:hypothetical protein
MSPHLKLPAKPPGKIESTAEGFFFITYPSFACKARSPVEKVFVQYPLSHQVNLTPL